MHSKRYISANKEGMILQIIEPITLFNSRIPNENNLTRSNKNLLVDVWSVE